MSAVKRHKPIHYYRYGVSLIKKIFASIIGHLFYKSQYLKGKDFSKFQYSNGWRWVMESFFIQKVVGYQRHIPFPVSFRSQFMNWEHFVFDIDDLSNFQKCGCYFQAASDAYIYIGKGSYIAPNVGIITANHDEHDLSKPTPGKDVRIGEKCWIGMNSMILPGVVLGEGTIVGAGSVVTKSFEEGHCIIVGNPARLLRRIESEHKEED